jgi:hypothetical protein
MLMMFEHPRRFVGRWRATTVWARTAFIAARVARDTPDSVLSADASAATAWGGGQ